MEKKKPTPTPPCGFAQLQHKNTPAEPGECQGTKPSPEPWYFHGGEGSKGAVRQPAAPELCRDPGVGPGRTEPTVGITRSGEMRPSHSPLCSPQFHPVLVETPLPRAAVSIKEGGICPWRRIGVSPGTLPQRPSLPGCQRCTFRLSRVGTVEFWVKKLRFL